MTPLQLHVMRGFSRHSYMILSASEAGNPEIQAMFDTGLVEDYWGAAGILWHLTRKGREELVRLGLAKTADQLVIDAVTGTVEQVP